MVAVFDLGTGCKYMAIYLYLLKGTVSLHTAPSLIRRPMMGELTVTRILSLTMRLVKSMIGSGFIGGILRK